MKKSKVFALFVLILTLNQMGCSLFESKEKSTEVVVALPMPTGEMKTAAESDDLYTTYELKDQPAKSPAIRESEVVEKGIGLAKRAMVSKDKAAHGGAMLAEMAVPTANYGVHHIPLNTESYDNITENKLFIAKIDPLSTFSIDVDTASYSNMRRFIEKNQKPPADAIRVEELINYFSYDYPAPNEEPFSVNLETAQAPWDSAKKLVRIGIKGKEMKVDKRPASNLVFLIDVSGSMDSQEKLPLVKSAMTMLVDRLDKNDSVSIVVYAGAAGLVLEPTKGDEKRQIISALDRLKAGGSTNGSGGIELAYKTASKNFIKGGVNRVVLATDGDFNVGTTSREGLLDLIKKHADQNIYLSVLGFGMGNYKDGMMETISNKGNGNYAYVDNLNEARKVMVEQMSGTLVTIAKDVKIQVEFNPQLVESYRLIGYENRILNHQDFNDDKKDAGDIGAGHTVTALYEITPVGAAAGSQSGVDRLKYQIESKTESRADQTTVSGELLTVKLRFKKPDGFTSKKIEIALQNSDNKFNSASESFKFTSAVAMFGMHVRESQIMKSMNLSQIREIAQSAKGEDKNGYRKEFIQLIEKYDNIIKGHHTSTIGYVEE